MAAGIAQLIATTKPGLKSSELYTTAGTMAAIYAVLEFLLSPRVPADLIRKAIENNVSQAALQELMAPRASDFVIVVVVVAIAAQGLFYGFSRFGEKVSSKFMASPKRLTATLEDPTQVQS